MNSVRPTAPNENYNQMGRRTTTLKHEPSDGDCWEIPDFGLGRPGHADDDDSPDGFEGRGLPLFSVSNPAGAVTATASIAGRLHRVELTAGSRSLPALTEAELAQEILLVGRLAGQRARSELFRYLVEQTAEAGQDPVATGRFLRDDVGLPTPEESAAARAEAFGARYLESHG